MEQGGNKERFRASLTATESQIVDLLLDADGAVVPREQILNVLSGRAPRTLDTYMKQIRAKIRKANMDPATLMTHVGAGYSLRM